MWLLTHRQANVHVGDAQLVAVLDALQQLSQDSARILLTHCAMALQVLLQVDATVLHNYKQLPVCRPLYTVPIHQLGKGKGGSNNTQRCVTAERRTWRWLACDRRYIH